MVYHSIRLILFTCCILVGAAPLKQQLSMGQQTRALHKLPMLLTPETVSKTKGHQFLVRASSCDFVDRFVTFRKNRPRNHTKQHQSIPLKQTVQVVLHSRERGLSVRIID